MVNGIKYSGGRRQLGDAFDHYKTLKLSGLPLGDIWEAKNGEEGLRIIQDKWIDLP